MSDLQIGNYKFFDREGKLVEMQLNVHEYEAAAEAHMDLPQYLQSKYGNDSDQSKGTVFNQILVTSGLLMKDDPQSGMRSPTFADVISGKVLMAGATVRGDGENRHTPNGRLLFPAIIMAVQQANLREQNDSFLGQFNRLVAMTDSINGPLFDQPRINLNAPGQVESQAVAELAEAPSLVSITTSNSAHRIPTRAIGMMISAEAQRGTTLNLVQLAMTRQAEEQRVRDTNAALKAILEGDTDRGESAKTDATVNKFIRANQLDSNVSVAGTLSHRAYRRWLIAQRRTMTLDWIVTDLAGAEAIEDRANRPTIQTNFAPDPESILNATFTADNLVSKVPKVLIVDDGLLTSGRLYGLDSRYAIRKVVNVSASYSAIEEFVLRKATGFRADYAEAYYTLMPDAFRTLSLATS